MLKKTKNKFIEKRDEKLLLCFFNIKFVIVNF